MSASAVLTPPFSRPARRSAASDVQAELQAQIESGRYKLNDRLPSEAELARAFGVSRPVIREALMSLQALGLTASHTGKGTFVLSNRVGAPLLMGQYSPAHIREVRRCVEIPSARLAAERRTEQDVGALSALLARLEDADDPQRRNRLDAGFHIAIAAAAGNPLMAKLVEQLRTVLEEHSLALARIPQRRENARSEHRLVYEAIVRRDPDGAAAAMEAHLLAAERSFISRSG